MLFDDPDGEGTKFEPYDIKMLVGYTLIAWAVAFALSVTTLIVH